ncbi:MAG: enoyl-CoA hydratase-related protein [Pseudomonadota bacterium]
MSDTLQIEARGDVDWVTLNRPDSLNALNPELTEALCLYFEGLYRQHDRRVVVLKGAGRGFCSGLDLQSGTADRDWAKHAPLQAGMATQRRIGDIYRAMRRCPQPIIALIQGAATGGGLSLALASDIRIAGPKAKLNCAYIRIGLTGADMGSSYFLPRIVGLSMASELLLTGRFVHADEALRIGLVSHLVDEDALDRTAQSLIEHMLRTAPFSLRLTKEALGYAVDAPSLDAAMAMEDRQQILTSQSKDHIEAMTAFMAKRDPEFGDR